MAKAKIIEADITDLKFDDKNFNVGSEFGNNLMDKSFSQFKAGRGALVDKHNNIIAGNKSIEKFGELGGKKVIIVETTGDEIVVTKRTDIDLNTPQGREMALADNATAKANIVWAEDVICEEVGVEVAESWGVEMKNDIELEAQEDDFDTTPPEEPITVLGDLYEIGEHRLLCGDSTCSDSVAKLMNGNKADMVMTDPPYNVAYEGGTGLTIMNDEMDNDSFYTFLLLFYKAFADVTKDGGAWYVWHADSEGVNFRKAFQESGLLMKQCLIWVKNALVMGRQDYHWKHEPCLYGWKAGAAHYFTNDRTKTTVIHHDKPLKNGEHPTMKPILLLAPLIENSSKPKWIVGDPFLGSGSTMVASHQLKRKCYGMELDCKYVDVIVKRMLKLDKTLKIKKNGIDETETWLKLIG